MLRIRITAEVGDVRREYEIVFSRYGRNVAMGRATARADAPGGREEDAKRLAAVIKALTGREPWIRRRSDGAIELVCGEGASGRLQALRRASRRHREVARRDELCKILEACVGGV